MTIKRLPHYHFEDKLIYNFLNRFLPLVQQSTYNCIKNLSIYDIIFQEK